MPATRAAAAAKKIPSCMREDNVGTIQVNMETRFRRGD
jgi:hypothetical protein